MGSKEMKHNECIKVILGDEYDEPLRARLFQVLLDLGAVQTTKGAWALAGSQELSEIDVFLDGLRIHIESETYIGLSIAGPLRIVERIKELVNSPP